MAGRPMKPIPHDADPAIAQFVGELRDLVLAAADGTPVSDIAEHGSLGRSTFLHALSGRRLPTTQTVNAIIDSIAIGGAKVARKRRATSSYTRCLGPSSAPGWTAWVG